MKRQTTADRTQTCSTLWIGRGWKPLLALAAVLTMAGAASAQTTTGKQDKTPPVGYRPGAIPMPGVGVLTPPNTVNGVPVGARPGAVTVPQTSVTTSRGTTYYSGGYYSGYYGGYPYAYYPGYVAYPGGSTVVVSQPYGYYANGYPVTAGPGGVAVSSDVVSTTVTLGGGTQVTVFNGYAPAYVVGGTLLSPYGGLYGCLPYIRSSYALTGAVYPYAGGTEVASIPYTAAGDIPYGTDTWVSSNIHRTSDLRSAIGDIERFWLNGDTTALSRRINTSEPVAVLKGGRYAYSLDRSSLLALSQDARKRAATVSFGVTNVRRRDDGLVTVHARHLYRLSGDSAGRAPRATRIDSTLAWENGTWRLRALSAAGE